MVFGRMHRRAVLRAVGVGISAGFAGCSGSGDDGSESEPSNSETANPDNSDTPDETAETGTGENTTGSPEQTANPPEQYEDDESEAEIEGEERLTNFYQGWIEFEEFSDQVPPENYTLEEFPSLEILDAEVTAYSDDNIAVYLSWGPDRNENLTLVVQAVQSYEETDGTQEDYSNVYMDGDADIEGILREVIEGFTDVSPNLDEEYAEILGIN